MANEQEFEGKVVVVTGSAGGIGWEILQQFVNRGARGVMSDIDEDLGRPRADAMGERVSFCKADVRDEAHIDALVEHCVAEHGRLDVWVNNAGVGVHTLAVDTTLEDFELQVDVQLIGAFLGARAAARQMIAQGGGGRVINIGSSAARNARKGAASHCSAKAGGAMLSQVLALEWGEHGITVNMVSPGTHQQLADHALFRAERRIPPELPADGAGRAAGETGGDRRGLRLPGDGRRRVHHRA